MEFRLRVFVQVAQNLSFSKASKSLHLSQPAVSKHIREIENKYAVKLFDRQGNSIALTPAGEDLLAYAHKILAMYDGLEDHFLSLQKKLPKELKLGASTTIAQYIFPKSLAEIKQRFPDTSFTLINDNSATIEKKIENNALSFALIEGSNHNPLLQYEKFLDDELVLVSNTKNKQSSVILEDLPKLPLVLREEGSGTRNILENHLQKIGIDKKSLQTEMVLGSTESIKTYLYYGNSYAFVSIFSVLEELKANKLQIIDIDDFEIKRPLYFVSKQGYQSSFLNLLKKFFQKDYNQKL
ncbi:LysR family transcriptional regulator [Haloflavibacter putidus]|uniref:LysR family transcriptional regulator n=1 Tax=Haloflavibacter putidus TaxID=2576776 RepID=A0A507ZUX8_9FLAO|nr:LysR family transcriptional regulator [Haloflavibacter putidus]TQD40044.1 LysR family transcriptional regulator [Haloflavibacter putidus]